MNALNFKRRSNGFVKLGLTTPFLEHLPLLQVTDDDRKMPRRKRRVAPLDNNTFIKPLKQCFVKNPRMMPMTRVMLALISGWAGKGGPIETTTGIIAKHLRRCRRQVFRYLKDAMEEGYLFYSRTKDRIGRYTGIRIILNLSAIRFSRLRKPTKRPSAAENLDVTLKSETNSKSLFIREDNPKLYDILERFGQTIGCKMPDKELE